MSHQKQPAAMVMEPVSQPAGQIKLCIFCRQELSEPWIRISRTGRDGYSVATHPDCLARSRRRPAQ